MCKESGVSRGSLGDLYHGRIKSLSTKTLQKIADYFDVSVDYLVGKNNIVLGDELKKIIKDISIKLNENYDYLVDLFLRKEFPRTVNYNSLLYFFATYLGKDIDIVNEENTFDNDKKIIKLISQLTAEQQELVLAQIEGILNKKNNPQPK